MQRYHASSGINAVNSSALGGISTRDTGRADSSSTGNYSLNSRRPTPLTTYKLKCEKDGLSSRLGPPDFHPPTSSSPEENLTKEYVQIGYKETVEGLEEAKEIALSHVQAFSKPVVLKCKEAVRKCLRAINESRTRKRKAGQVYGVPLCGSLVFKPGFPEPRPCGEETRKKWIESLSQQHKQLRALADHVPQVHKRKALFEVLIRNNVPLLRATWFIKVTYLNLVRPGSAALSSGAPDKALSSRCELWTKDVIDYLQYLLDELLSRNNSCSAPHSRDRSPQMLYTGAVQKITSSSAALDAEDPSPHFKWWYMVRLLQWHSAEGLLLPSLIIDWVLKLLQEKEAFEILQLLLPIVYGVLESIVLSQNYVQGLVAIAVRFIREPSPGGSDLVDNSRRAYAISALIEMVRYLIQATPDTFVASEYLPLPPSIAAYGPNEVSFASKLHETLGKPKSSSAEVSSQFHGRGFDSRFESLSSDYIVSSIQRSAEELAKRASTGYPQYNTAKAVQALDKALSNGDIGTAYSHLFEDLCDGAVDEAWICQVSPCLRSSLRWIGAMNTSFVCSVFFLCEWATCDFRDFRTGVPRDIKFTGRKDYSQVYLVIQILKQNILGAESGSRRKNHHNNFVGIIGRSSKPPDLFESPGPLHDIIVCWIDQHEVHRRGAKRLQLLVFELIRAGIFSPVAYVRQLIVSGIIDAVGPTLDLERRMRHHQILKQLTGSFVRNMLEEAQIMGGTKLYEAVKKFSNERHLLLQELHADKSKYLDPSPTLTSVDMLRTENSMVNVALGKHTKRSVDITELKECLSALLQFPDASSCVTDSMPVDSQGSVKRLAVSVCSKMDQEEATPGFEDNRKAKRPKLSEEKRSCSQGHSPVPSDEEDNWWTRKGTKSLESLKVDPPPKSMKPVPRGRQKTMRKTQSLAQLQAARIESSQGASTSHVCESKVNCPHHGPGMEGENPKVVDVFRTSCPRDIVSIANSFKQLRFFEKKSVTLWLTTVVRQLVEDSEKSVARLNRGVPVEENSAGWRLGEDELSAMLYLMDVSHNLVSAVRFLLWLLPKTNKRPSFTTQGGRNLMITPRNVENRACEVGEVFLISSLRRYENILLSADIIPEVLSALVGCAGASMSSNGRVSGSATLIYARHLLKRYGNLASVVEWQKNIKATCDKRLLSELDHGQLGDGEYGIPLGVPAGVDNPDDYLRQKISATRLSRVGLNMRDVVQRHVEEASHHFRKLLGAVVIKDPFAVKSEDGLQVAQQIVVGLMDCIRQTGGAAQEGDPSLVSSAVSAIINSVGSAIARISDFTIGNNSQNHQSATGSSRIARYVLRIHTTCLCLLKEALGERQSRVFEIALATESSTALAGVFAPGKASRSQYQSSPESYDSNVNTMNEMTNNTIKVSFGRATKVTAAISALMIGAITHGAITLERMVGLLRLRECLDFVQFVRSTKSSSNGSARSLGAFKVENSFEVYVHWFRLLVGNCKTVSDGLLLELLGEPSVAAISHMQRMLPLNLVFPPAYAIFAFVLWRPFVLNNNSYTHDDSHRLYQSLTMAINDVIKHLPFRDVCLRDTRGLYDLITADPTDAEFASVMELNGLDMHLKPVAFVPLRARLFLNAIVDCKMPASVSSRDGVSETKNRLQVNRMKLVDQLVCLLDNLQPAKFHWQWVELRLLLNEQALIEKLENHDISMAEIIKSSSPTSEKPGASENENNFIEIILTRLLVRPDAVPLFSELVHLFGRSLADSVLMQAKWFLAGQDVLFGRKTIRQRLMNIAETKGLPTKPQFWKPWGWCNSAIVPAAAANKAEKKKKSEITYIEEGEVVEEGTNSKTSSRAIDGGPNFSHGLMTERAFVKLVLPCIDQSSDESRSTFANDLIKQFNNIEQQISSVTRGSNKQTGNSSGSDVSSNKVSIRKGIRGSSPGMARRSLTFPPDSVPPSPAALRASMSLRLQFLLRLLPIICTDGEPSGQSTRHALASIIIRLLGSRIVYEDSSVYSACVHSSQSKAETELAIEPNMADLSSEVLFDRLLFVLHGLLSNNQPCWLKSRPASKLRNESSKGFASFDRDAAEGLQCIRELERMQLPDIIRWRIQAAMPILYPSLCCSLSCQPPCVPATALTVLQPSGSAAGVSSRSSSNPPQRNTTASMSKSGTTAQGKSKQSPQQQPRELDADIIDPWMLLEDGTGSGPLSHALNSDHTNLRAASWLKGAVRVRRTDLTYIGAADDDG